MYFKKSFIILGVNSKLHDWVLHLTTGILSLVIVNISKTAVLSCLCPALNSQFDSRYFEWQKHNSYSDRWIRFLNSKSMPTNDSSKHTIIIISIWHYLFKEMTFFFFIARLDSLAIDHHWAPGSALQLTITAAAHYRRSCWCDETPRPADCSQVGGKASPRRLTHNLQLRIIA